MTDEERFLTRVVKSDGCWTWTGRRINGRYGCWTWTGRRINGRYGNFTVGNDNILAHRWAYRQWVGPLVAGLFVCHHCDNPPCVRPDHLYQGSRADNVRDALARGRQVHGERNGTAKLTVEQVRLIRSLPGGGQWSNARLGQRFGVSPSRISDIRSGKTWKRVATDGRVLASW